MTRKQALSLAMEALARTGADPEAAAVLRSLSDDLPLNHWSDAAIRDAVEQFILDHGRAPTVTDFKRKGLPPHPVIQNRYGVTLARWLEENYPARRPDPEEARRRMTDAFVKDYRRIRPKSADEFNARRAPGTPCWRTVAAHNRLKRWRDLLDRLSLPVFSPGAPPREPASLRVRIHTHYDFRD